MNDKPSHFLKCTVLICSAHFLMPWACALLPWGLQPSPQKGVATVVAVVMAVTVMVHRLGLCLVESDITQFPWGWKERQLWASKNLILLGTNFLSKSASFMVYVNSNFNTVRFPCISFRVNLKFHIWPNLQPCYNGLNVCPPHILTLKS